MAASDTTTSGPQWRLEEEEKRGQRALRLAETCESAVSLNILLACIFLIFLPEPCHSLDLGHRLYTFQVILSGSFAFPTFELSSRHIKALVLQLGFIERQREKS